MAQSDLPLALRITNGIIGITYKNPKQLMFYIGWVAAMAVLVIVGAVISLSSYLWPSVAVIVICLPLFVLSVATVASLRADSKARQVVHGRITSLHREQVGHADARTTSWRIVITDNVGNSLMYAMKRTLHKGLSEGTDVRVTVAPRTRWVFDAVTADR